MYRQLINNWFLIALGIVLLLISFNNYWYSILYGTYLIYLYKINKNFLYLVIFISVLILLLFFYLSLLTYHFPGFAQGKIINIDYRESYQQITIRKGIHKLLIYDYQNQDYNVGMIIKVEGRVMEIDDIHVPYEFDYRKYLQSKNIKLVINSSQTTIIKKSFSIYYLNERVNIYLENHFQDESLIFLKAFILGDTSGFSNEINHSLKTNGIIHLFAVSGLHLSLFINLIQKLSATFKINKKNTNIIINSALLIYLFIVKFNVAILRATMTHYLIYFNKKYHGKLTSLDIVSLVFILMIITNVYYIYQFGFILSFLIVFAIHLIRPYFSKSSNFTKNLIISLASFIVSLPLIINLNHEINFLTPIINVLLIYLVTIIVLPFSYLTIFLAILDLFYQFIILSFVKIVNLISQISSNLSLVVNVKHFDNWDFFIYYAVLGSLIILFQIMKKKSRWFLVGLYCLYLLIIVYNINFFKNPEVVFFDLYNGESTLIITKNSTIVIDTGDGTNSVVTKYLKARGIKKIDYLILSHNHNDHNGEAALIISTFQVKCLVLNKYDDSIYQNNVLAIKVGSGDVLNTKDLVINFLHPNQDYGDENDNSLVFYFEIAHIRYLFMSDVSKNVEANFHSISADIIKIGHHGSKTSTSKQLIAAIRPQYAIIMNGRISHFAFPHIEVLEILRAEGVKIYDTKTYYTIKIINLKNQCIIQTLK